MGYPRLALCDSFFSLMISITLSFLWDISLNLYCNASIDFFNFFTDVFLKRFFKFIERERERAQAWGGKGRAREKAEADTAEQGAHRCRLIP